MNDDQMRVAEDAIRKGQNLATALSPEIHAAMTRSGSDNTVRLLWCAGFLSHVFGGFAFMLGEGAARELFRNIGEKRVPR